MRDHRLKSFSDQDIAAMRLRCVEPYIAHASKQGVSKEEIFIHAEKSWEFMLKALDENEKVVTPENGSTDHK